MAHEADSGPQSVPAGMGIGHVAENRLLLGEAHMRRVGLWSYPVHHLTADGRVLARLGRSSGLRIFFGAGQRIELADGTEWRLRAFGAGGMISPVIVDSDRRRVAVAGIGHGVYGINTRDLGCVFYPTDTGWGGRKRWVLRHDEAELAVVTRSPLSIYAVRPVPLGAALMCFALVRHGIAGEAAPRLPSFSWSQP